MHQSLASCCRSCGRAELVPFLSLGRTPLANALLSSDQLEDREPSYPLGLAFCPSCTLVQATHDTPAEVIFTADYPYHSSFAQQVVDHGRAHAKSLMTEHMLGPDHLVVEVASNDGYLLRSFVDAGVGVLGIDPSPGPAEVAQAQGVPTLVDFFGSDLATKLASDGLRADVVIANNVLAHVRDLNGFVAGIAKILTDDGVATFENAYVGDLIEHVEFDTVYHEHYCYLSTLAVDALMRRHGLHLTRVEHFPELHGGSLRWTVRRVGEPEPSVARFLDEERRRGLDQPGFYAQFGQRVSDLQHQLRTLLVGLRAEGKRVAAYGAAAKGATLLNTSNIPHGLIEYVVDRNVHKQGRFMPGVHLEVRDPSVLTTDRPDYLLLLAWNFTQEIRGQLVDYELGGGRFIVPVPRPEILQSAGAPVG